MSPHREVLIDSTFLLPTLGVEVSQVSQSDLKELAKLRSKMKFFCIYQSLVEVMGKVGREYASTSKESVPQIIEEGLRSLLESDLYTWTSPSTEALMAAAEMRRKGHKDMIDNMLYSTASDVGMLFLSIDVSLIRFLEENHYSTDEIVNVKKLRSLVV
jgi:hypothetical protein